MRILLSLFLETTQTHSILRPDNFDVLLDPKQKYVNLNLCRTSVCKSLLKCFYKCTMLTELTISNCTSIDSESLCIITQVSVNSAILFSHHLFIVLSKYGEIGS